MRWANWTHSVYNSMNRPHIETIACNICTGTADTMMKMMALWRLTFLGYVNVLDFTQFAVVGNNI